jgi:hypothetical protein
MSSWLVFKPGRRLPAEKCSKHGNSSRARSMISKLVAGVFRIRGQGPKKKMPFPPSAISM